MANPDTLADGKRLLAVAAAIAMTASTFVLMAGSAGAAQAPLLCDGQAATIVGTSGDDTLIGTSGNDVIVALQGDDIVKAGAGDDIICGGFGNDSLFGGMGFDVIFGAQGDDFLVSSKSKLGMDSAGSQMFGGAGDDDMHGSTGWDRMQGGAGNDSLYGEGSRDWLRGGAGNDYVEGGLWVDDVNGGYGNDRIIIEGSDRARGGPGKRDICVLRANSADATFVGCERVNGLPAAGSLGSVSMGRANWSSGYVHAEILRELLVEVGYEVSEPADLEFAPDLAYRVMASGAMDFWANSWYPFHNQWWQGSRPDGSIDGDHLERIEGSVLPGGGLQGMLVTKSWAEQNDVTTLDQINADEALWSQLDTDNDGRGEFYGCPESWTCDDIMDSQIAFAGWDNIEQVSAGYDAMFAEFLSKAEADEPAIMYIWAPTSYYARANVGETTMWVSVKDESVLDDSNPLGIPGGEAYCQSCRDSTESEQLSAENCFEGPDGCLLGWEVADIEVTANKAWLADNPVAAEMFSQFKPTLDDLSNENLTLTATDGSTDAVNRIAADWITNNRVLVDSWVAAAISAR